MLMMLLGWISLFLVALVVVCVFVFGFAACYRSVPGMGWSACLIVCSAFWLGLLALVTHENVILWKDGFYTGFTIGAGVIALSCFQAMLQHLQSTGPPRSVHVE